MVQILTNQGVWRHPGRTPKPWGFIERRTSGISYRGVRDPEAGIAIPVHRIVYETWVGEIGRGHVVDHVDDSLVDEDGCKINCVTNLSAITQLANMRKSKSFNASDEVKARIKKLRRGGMKTTEIAKVVGLSQSCVSHILSGRIGGSRARAHHTLPLSEKQVFKALEAKLEGATYERIGELIGRDPSTIRRNLFFAKESSRRDSYYPMVLRWLNSRGLTWEDIQRPCVTRSRSRSKEQ